ncbi:GNAT family N-acetyltransferase [Dyadobacter arcticus]|uniref:GNAT family N-acetyltransferase n=1 Tax=Dyadobacter arcticus TaxID=1078754 RepID=A0ABX0UPL2_9BACT|nr:GNAT family N-acetyltransferase [Dyadobacter arcticus]NIJ54919.1 hypothetical protein [Dyadobacter arcticus]
MTPLLISRSQINDAAWNKLIEQSGQAVVYGFTFYLDLVCDDWKALIWASEGDYQIVMPLPVRRRLGIQLIHQPLFCQYLGLFSRSELTASQAEIFLRLLSMHFSYISSYHFNPNNYHLFSDLTSQFREFEFHTQFTHWLHLAKDYKSIEKGYTTDRRTNLKKGKNAGWEILESSNIHPLIYLFVQNHAAKIAGGVNPNAYDRLEAIFEKLKLLGIVELHYACKNGVIHAGILIVRCAGKSIYLFNAADVIGRRCNARTFLLDAYFSANAGNSIIFDFESPEIHSIAGFYKSFGCEATPFLKIRKNRLWLPIRKLHKWREKWLLKTR